MYCIFEYDWLKNTLVKLDGVYRTRNEAVEAMNTMAACDYVDRYVDVV